MRILHISTRLILGGSQENTVLSCEGQARLGHDVHLAFGPIYGPEGSLLKRVQDFNARCARGAERTRAGKPCPPITTHTVPSLVREVSPRADLRCRGELERLIATIRPDIVHTHSSKAGVLGRWSAWRARTRSSNRRPAVIHTIHGPPFMPVDGSLVKRLKTRASNAAYALAERFAARRCHLIISVADAMTREYLRRGLGKAGQYITVRSGMETGPFLATGPQTRREVRARLGLAESDIVIGTVARLAEHKGHDDLLSALGEDLRAHPNWKLLWVGDGWWRERLIERARGIGIPAGAIEDGPAPPSPSRTSASAGTPMPRGIPPQLILTGLVPPERVPELISAMDILAHPSYREGLPRTVPQALLCGIAPIAYDVDGTAEVCRDMQTGRLAKPGDTAGLRDGIRWLIAHPDERRAMAERGREECRGAFSAERMVAELEKVYARALAMV